MAHYQRQQTHCKAGHPFDDANTYVTAKQKRACRRCRTDASVRSRNRASDRAYWRGYEDALKDMRKKESA